MGWSEKENWIKDQEDVNNWEEEVDNSSEVINDYIFKHYDGVSR